MPPSVIEAAAADAGAEPANDSGCDIVAPNMDDLDVGDVSGHADERPGGPAGSSATSSGSVPNGAASSSSDMPPANAEPLLQQGVIGIAADALTGTRFYTKNGGRMSFYSHFGGSKRFFECECPNKKGHGRCVLTRVVPAEYNAKVANRGRLVGYLAAWLNAGHNDTLATKAAHRAYEPSVEERLRARAELAADGNGRKMLSIERAPLADEPLEHAPLIQR